MNLIRAETKAKYLINELQPFCDQIAVVGNIRRGKQSIDRIDILLAPKGAMLFELMAKIVVLGSGDGVRVASSKIIFLKDELGDIKAELWFTTLEKWPVMLFLKTGGNRSVQRIAKLCELKNWHLSVSDAAIYDENGKKLLIKEEEDIFKLLEVPFIEPSRRE